MICSYCGEAKAIHNDHIVSKAMRRRHPGWDDVVVPSCSTCNWRKGTRRLVPHDYPDEEFAKLPGTRPWKRWDGTPVTEVLR